MGLPEVMLGIVPGWGGMLRLPQRIGAQAALDMMLTGKSLDARKARRLGLADDCVAARVMDNAAALLVASGQPRRRPPFWQRLANGPFKLLVAAAARRQVAKRARAEHYPAPYAIIDIWSRHRGNALAAPQLIDSIVRSPTARNLLRVFFLQERLKSFGKGSAQPARRIHVVGAGVMGGDIAAWCALRGLTVTLQDQGIERIAPALQRAHAAYRKRIKDHRELRTIMDRLIPDPQGHGVRHADLVIGQIDRLPLPVNSAPGFLVNAVLGPYMLEAMRAVDEGIAPESVDAAMLAFGMPMGPIELIDLIGLDVALAAGKSLTDAAPPQCLSERVEVGQLGRKSGRGFYAYRGERARKGHAGALPAGLAARLIKPLLERTEQLLADGVVADADLADAGVIFGTSFAPFTGGPINYLRNQRA